jgi:DNA-binding NarL/FixJ family response regulator
MKEVGESLGMTPRTVAFHKYQIMARIGAKSNAELVKYALRNGMHAASQLETLSAEDSLVPSAAA